jgi:hypothetical protein
MFRIFASNKDLESDLATFQWLKMLSYSPLARIQRFRV